MSVSSIHHLAERRLTELGIALPAFPMPVANYVPFTISGNLLFISGQGPRTVDEKYMTGKVGRDVTADEAYAHARLVGINTSWMIALGWGMAAAIGSIAGMLIAPVVFLEPNMMGGVLIYGFAAAVLGGLTSPFGAVVGGFLVGIFENLVGTYIPGVGNELKLPIALALIISVLVVNPAGLFGRPIVKRV